MILENRR